MPQAAAAPPPEPAVNVNSPRAKAAMRVLGIHPKDLQSKSRSDFEDGMPGQVKHEIYERKRLALLANVSNQVAAVSQVHHLSQQSSSEDGGTNTFLADVLAREKKNLAKIRDKAKDDILKIVETEMAAKEATALRLAKAEEYDVRMKEMRKSQKEKLDQQKKEAQKKYEKTLEVRARCDRQRESEAQELIEGLEKKLERSENQLHERQNKWDEHRQKCQEERVRRYDKQEKLVAGLWKGREKVYADILERDDMILGRLDELTRARVSNAAEMSAKTNTVIARAKTVLQDAQDARDKNYIERLTVHDKAKEFRETQFADSLKEITTRNKKEWAKIAKEKERKEKEIDDHYENPEVSARLTKSMSETFTSSPAWRTEATLKHFETNKTMESLIHVNRTHLKRAKDYSLDQALKKIADKKERVTALEQSKFMAQQRRYDMLKNVAIEKHHLTHQVNMVRDAPPHKLNGVLGQLGLPPLKTGKEETEEEEKKS